MANATAMPLEAEIQYFEKNKTKLLAEHEGKFVVIYGDHLLGAYDTVENAYNAGIQAFGDQQFLVRKATASEQNLTNLALMYGLINAHL
jgi:hypothetical protein